MEPDFFDTCKEIAALCLQENSPEWSAYLIQFFCEELENGETPHMAFVLAGRFREGKYAGTLTPTTGNSAGESE